MGSPPTKTKSSSSRKILLAAAAIIIIIPYFLGFFLSKHYVLQNYNNVSKRNTNDWRQKLLLSSFDNHGDESTSSCSNLQHVENFALSIHRNGEANDCSGVIEFTNSDFVSTFGGSDGCIDINNFDKFQVESLLTRMIAKKLNNNNNKCESQQQQSQTTTLGFLGFCDAGSNHTPILLDHHQLIRHPQTNTLPCRFHTREGVRIVSLQQLLVLLQANKNEEECVQDSSSDPNTCNSNSSSSLHLYAVPAGRVFMFAPKFVGEIFDLPHVTGADGLQVSLEVLSLSPVVMDVYNFFSKQESADLVRRALQETSETHRIKRSTTGATGNQIHTKRTSENGFDTHGKTSLLVKKRIFDVLGFDEYLEGHADGLQILRYNLTTAYIPHLDWIDDPTNNLKHDYDSGGTGGNRFATVLLYMSDLEEGDGGETVFVNGWPVNQSEQDRVEFSTALQQLRDSGDAKMVLQEGSWEEEMVAKCRSRLAIRPNSARAVLFYSQLPDGRPDPNSLHGGCPVLKGEKWAANLWVWNTPRDGFPGSPIKAKFRETKESTDNNKVAEPTPQLFTQIKAHFKNSGRNPQFARAELYFNGDTFWGTLGHGDPPISINTYEGHQWDVKVDGKIVKSWIVRERKGLDQSFEL